MKVHYFHVSTLSNVQKFIQLIERETQRHRKRYVLLTSSFFSYIMLWDCIEHYTARIDYNQDFYNLYIYRA